MFRKNYVTSSAVQRHFWQFSKICSNLTWHPGHNLTKYLPAEAVQKATEPPRETTEDRSSEQKQHKYAKTAVFARKAAKTCLLRLRNRHSR